MFEKTKDPIEAVQNGSRSAQPTDEQGDQAADNVPGIGAHADTGGGGAYTITLFSVWLPVSSCNGYACRNPMNCLGSTYRQSSTQLRYCSCGTALFSGPRIFPKVQLSASRVTSRPFTLGSQSSPSYPS